MLSFFVENNPSFFAAFLSHRAFLDENGKNIDRAPSKHRDHTTNKSKKIKRFSKKLFPKSLIRGTINKNRIHRQPGQKGGFHEETKNLLFHGT